MSWKKTIKIKNERDLLSFAQKEIIEEFGVHHCTLGKPKKGKAFLLPSEEKKGDMADYLKNGWYPAGRICECASWILDHNRAARLWVFSALDGFDVPKELVNGFVVRMRRCIDNDGDYLSHGL